MNGSAPKILAVTADAGGARAVIPVSQELLRRHVQIRAAVSGPSIGIWASEAPEFPRKETPDNISQADAKRDLMESHVDGLLSGCGLRSLEHTYRLAAREIGLPSVGVLDAWLNYRERFERNLPGGLEESRPDVLCVTDADTQDKMAAGGFRTEQLRLTGAPNLEQSIALVRRFDKEDAPKWRQARGVGKTDLCVTFFSDVMPRTGTYGYDPKDILSAVISELCASAESSERIFWVNVRPHPDEDAAALQTILSRMSSPNLRLEIAAGESPAFWIARSDLVIGMFSTVLLEAALAGKRTLSVQIGIANGDQPDPCWANHLGYGWSVFDRPALTKVLAELTRTPPPPVPEPRHPLMIENAAYKAASVVMDLVTKKGGTHAYRPA